MPVAGSFVAMVTAAVASVLFPTVFCFSFPEFHLYPFKFRALPHIYYPLIRYCPSLPLVISCFVFGRFLVYHDPVLAVADFVGVQRPWTSSRGNSLYVTPPPATFLRRRATTRSIHYTKPAFSRLCLSQVTESH